MTQQSERSDRDQRWCGICFAWREEVDGRCQTCGNAHMTGPRIPIGAAGQKRQPEGDAA